METLARREGQTRDALLAAAGGDLWGRRWPTGWASAGALRAAAAGRAEIEIDLDHPDLAGVAAEDLRLALATCASAGVVRRGVRRLTVTLPTPRRHRSGGVPARGLGGRGRRRGAEALAEVGRRREQFLALVAADPGRKLYGVNVHAGDGSDRLMTEAEQRDYERGLHSGTSFGEPLPRRVVRGIVLARLANFVEGHAAVTPALVEAVAQRCSTAGRCRRCRATATAARARSRRWAGCSPICPERSRSGSRRAWR